MKVLVGSTNPTKIESVRVAFSKYFDDVVVKGIAVESSVADQPFGEETFLGAKNRAESLKSEDAVFYVGTEAGIFSFSGKSFNIAVTCIINKKGDVGYGTTPAFPLPAVVMKEIAAGHVLGGVADLLTGTEQVARKGGIIGHLTKGVMERTEYNVHSITMALIPFVNKDIYSK